MIFISGLESFAKAKSVTIATINAAFMRVLSFIIPFNHLLVFFLTGIDNASPAGRRIYEQA